MGTASSGVLPGNADAEDIPCCVTVSVVRCDHRLSSLFAFKTSKQLVKAVLTWRSSSFVSLSLAVPGELWDLSSLNRD